MSVRGSERREFPAQEEAGDFDPELLRALAREAGVGLDPAQCDLLLRFARLLHRWNRVHNLTAIRSREDLLTHHLLDSIAVIPAVESALAPAARPGMPLRFLDVGSGGGLPGVPIAIARPRWDFTLVDAVGKKVAFLRQAVLELGLSNVSVRHEHLDSSRAAPAPERFDAAISRAFSSLPDFVSLTRARVEPGGTWLAMKGRVPDAEIAALAPGIGVADIVTLHVPRLGEERHLVVMRALSPA